MTMDPITWEDEYKAYVNAHPEAERSCLYCVGNTLNTEQCYLDKNDRQCEGKCSKYVKRNVWTLLFSSYYYSKHG